MLHYTILLKLSYIDPGSKPKQSTKEDAAIHRYNFILESVTSPFYYVQFQLQDVLLQ